MTNAEAAASGLGAFEDLADGGGTVERVPAVTP
jgi:hypothetical protein